MVATWLASQPMVPDFSCGFQFHLSSGTRSRVLRVLCISWSNSGNIDCPMVITASLAKSEFASSDTRRTKGELSSVLFDIQQNPILRSIAPRLVAPSRASVTQDGGRQRVLREGLTVRCERRKWLHGTSIHGILFEGFHRHFPILQKTRRARDGAVSGRGALHHARCGIEFDCHHREAPGGKHALALDGFF